MFIAIIALSLSTVFFFVMSMVASYKMGQRDRRIVELRKTYNALARETNEYVVFINRLQRDDFKIDDEEFDEWTEMRNKYQDIINNRLTSL